MPWSCRWLHATDAREPICLLAFRGAKEGKERASPLTLCAPTHCDLLRKSKYQRTELAVSPASPQASGPLHGLSSAGKTMLRDLHGSSGSWAASLCSGDLLRWLTLTTVFETHAPSPLHHPYFSKVTSHRAGWLHFFLSSLERSSTKAGILPVLFAPISQVRASWMTLVLKNPPANEGDTRDVGSIPGSGRSPAKGNDNPLQYPCLENPMGRGAWWTTAHRATKSRTRLNNNC